MAAPPPAAPTLAVPSIDPATASDRLGDAYADDARAAIAAYEAQLSDPGDPMRRGRLHYEIARLSEVILQDLARAETHYEQALAATAEHLPSLVGARRVALARGKFARAIELIDRELPLTGARSAKASLYLIKGRILEDRLDHADAARAAYVSASELAGPDPAVFRAIAQIDERAHATAQLDRVLESAANALVADPPLRAATLCQRARLRELDKDADRAIEIYAQAYALDPAAPGARISLERLYAQRGRWKDLVEVIERQVPLTEDLATQALLLHRVASVRVERLGDRAAARVALERAAEHRPRHPVVLESLARIYDEDADAAGLVRVLSEMAESTSDSLEQLGHLHRIGMLCVDSLDDRDGAIAAFEAVLAIDPTHIPTLRALAPLYQDAELLEALVAMHRGEAAALRDSKRRAVAHGRAADVLERLGRAAEAMLEHEHALALLPEQLSSFEALVRLYGTAERHHQLVELYERHLDRVDVERKIEYLFAIGDLYRGPLKDPEQAEHAYRRILRDRPKHLGAVHAMQRVAESTGRWGALVEALELEAKIESGKPAICDLLHRVGEILDEQLDRRDEAIARLRGVLALEPHHPATLATLGRIFHAERRWADLAEIYQRELESIQDGGAQVLLLHKLGELHARHLAAPDKAVDAYRRALDTDPQHVPSIQALSRILRDRGDWPELARLAELERENYQDPSTRALACFQLGQLYEEHLGDRATAERSYAQAIELRPGFRPAADALARVRAELGHWNELLAELERDADTLTDRALACATLLRAAEVARDHLNDPVRAVTALERVLERDPKHIGALSSLESLYRLLRRFERLAEILARLAEASADPQTRAMAMRERVRTLDLAGLGSASDRVEAWTTVLAARPDDLEALAGLEREALASGEPRVIASVDGRIASALEDPSLCAAHLTRRGEALEASGNPQALDVYRDALAIDPHNLAALRGINRLAEVLGDAEALVEAAVHEASIARSPREAADARVRAGNVRADQLGDRVGAIADFDAALQLWPDHEVAAARLEALIRAQGQFDRLAERLLRAASEATQLDRKAALWLAVSRIYARDLDNIGAAVSALKRLLGARPDDATALLELSKLLIADRRTEEAVVLLRRAASVGTGDTAAEAHFTLATGLEELGDHAQAFGHYEQAAKLRPSDRRILERVVALQLETGLFGAAIDTATRLREEARDAESRVAADLALARALVGVKRNTEAIDALADAIVHEGPGGRASSDLNAIATQPEHWERYVVTLREHLSAHPDAGVYLELARTLHDRLDQNDAARVTLVEGLRATEGDAGLRFELANFLRQANRQIEAVEQLQLVLMDDVVQIEAWRALAQTFDELGQSRARALANAALCTLEVATIDERDDMRGWQPRTDAIRPGALIGDTTADLHVARDQQAASAALLAAIVEALAKVRPADLGRHGIGSRDRLRSDHPLRQLTDRIASLFGLEEYEVFGQGQRDRGVIVENTSKPSILLPLWLADHPQAQQVFAITQAVVNVARGVFTIDLFTPRELDVLLAAAARNYVPGFGENIATADVLDEHQRTISRNVGRRRRKAHEIAAQAYAANRGPDSATLVQWIRQSARRIALVVADDLPGSFAAVIRSENLMGKIGIPALRSSPVLADLLRVWASRPAMMLRYSCGLLPSIGTAMPRS